MTGSKQRRRARERRRDEVQAAKGGAPRARGSDQRDRQDRDDGLGNRVDTRLRARVQKDRPRAPPVRRRPEAVWTPSVLVAF